MGEGRGYLVRCGKCGSSRNVGDTNPDSYWVRVCRSPYWSQCQALCDNPATVRLRHRSDGTTFWASDLDLANE